MIYHTGFLATDRTEDSALDALATSLLTRAEAGEVHLVQRRIAPNRFEYHMIERPRQ